MPQTTTLDDELAAIGAIETYGFADTEDGAVAVELAPAAEYDDLKALHELATEWDYVLTHQGEEHCGTSHWRLEVR